MGNVFPIDSFEGLISKSPEMRKIFEDIKKIAETGVPILMIGEPGTGKRSLARVIHKLSPKNEKQFTIFADFGGGEKGESVDVKAVVKLLAKGNIGTLYVEEIANLSLSEQYELMHYLGNPDTTKDSSYARIVAATRYDVKGLIKEGRFRGDLYSKFFAVRLPPLCDRQEDILPLAEFFFIFFSGIYKKERTELHPKAVSAITRHSWPGNIAELENRVKKAVIIAGKSKIMPADLELEFDEEVNENLDFKKAREKFEKDFLEKAIIRNRGNITRAAKEIGISRPSFYEMIKKYDIKT